MLMKNKKGLIMGVANNRSIAWGIAKSIAKQGGQLAFTYQGEALKKRVLPLAQSVGSDIVIPCDVTDSSSITKTFEILSAPDSVVAVPTTVAPASPKVNAIAFPIPLDAPVIRTNFPSSI